MNERKVSISNGNIKMGRIKSVSLPPVITCPKGCPCSKKCYALRMVKRFPNVKKAYQNNLELCKENIASYFHQIYIEASLQRFFRFHVSGDIPNRLYYEYMTALAIACPNTEFLAFTKQYQIVNDVISEQGKPSNLHIVFSEWGDGWKVPNPYNLPTAKVHFKGDTSPVEGFRCPGNCENCARACKGCWGLKKGQSVVFDEH